MKRTRAKAKAKPTVYEKFHVELACSEVKQKSPQKPVEVSFLNAKQKKVYDLVEQKLKAKKSQTPLRLVCQGTAGTGKSCIVNAICRLFQSKKVKYRVCSFTGAASFLVGGATMHRTFHLPMYFHGSDPNAVKEARDLEKIEYFIFDEMSLIGLKIFGWISQRLKTIHSIEEPFGNQNYLLFGDFSQIRPVGDRALFTSNELGLLENLDLEGYLAYQAIDRAVVLEESMRQAGSAQEGFRQMLLRMRKGQLNNEDIEKLTQRYVRNLPEEEWAKFSSPDVVFLFAERAAVHKYNMFRLEQLDTQKHEFMPIVPKNIPPGSTVPLVLAVGARVFLNYNVHVASGLYNGALGTVSEIGPARKDGRAPQCIFVRFDNYNGPRFGIRDDIPILIRKGPASSTVNDCTWTQEQWPLELAWALTVHKSQGSELKNVVLGLPEDEGRGSMFFRQAPSLFFVAISRVKSLNDVAFSKPFNPDLVVKKYPGAHLTEWLAEEERLRAMDLE